MPKTITIPQDLAELISARAAARGKSVDTEAAELLAKALANDTGEAELMIEIRAEREEMARSGVFLTPEFIDEAKRWGRE